MTTRGPTRRHTRTTISACQVSTRPAGIQHKHTTPHHTHTYTFSQTSLKQHSMVVTRKHVLFCLIVMCTQCVVSSSSSSSSSCLICFYHLIVRSLILHARFPSPFLFFFLLLLLFSQPSPLYIFVLPCLHVVYECSRAVMGCDVMGSCRVLLVLTALSMT